MEKVQIGSNNFTEIMVLDPPGAGGAQHEYNVRAVSPDGEDGPEPFAVVHLQNGAIKESGVNGAHHEDLLAIVIHRLRAFQSGEYPCRENALAITKIEEAMHWLRHRTNDRNQRGVEGTSEK